MIRSAPPLSPTQPTPVQEKPFLSPKAARAIAITLTVLAILAFVGGLVALTATGVLAPFTMIAILFAGIGILALIEKCCQGGLFEKPDPGRLGQGSFLH